MARFNTKTSTKTVNKAGGVAYSMDKEMELIHAVLTTFLDDKYYESGKRRMQRLVKLVSENKPEFVAKLAYVARKEFYLRPIYILYKLKQSILHPSEAQRTIKSARIFLKHLLT